MIDEHHATQLSLLGIKLKNETTSCSIMQLKNSLCDTRIAQPLYKSLLSAIELYNLRSIDLPKITFGVELEFVGDANLKALCDFNMAMVKLLSDKYYYTDRYCHNDGNQWILGKDGSIKFDSRSNEFGYELSSAKMNLFNECDIILLKNVLACIENHLHGRVNTSCGTHIHLGFSHSGSYNKIYRRDISHILRAYSKMEEIAFDPLVPAYRRRNTYCESTEPIIGNKRQKLSARYCRFNDMSNQCEQIRFEARQLEGTLDLTTILNWATLQTNVIYDIMSHLDNSKYIKNLTESNSFDLLFKYDLSSDCISFFIDRIVKFKSRKLFTHCKSCI